MANPAEKLPEPEPLPESAISSDQDSNIFAKAVHDVAYKIGGAEFASSVTSLYRLDHQGALKMLDASKDLVQARFLELKQQAEQRLPLVQRFNSAVMRYLRGTY